MKALKFFLIIVIISISITGCNEKHAPRPRRAVVVMKFKNPDYKNYILANYRKGDEFIFGMRFNNCIDPIGEAGYSPYWNLPMDWLLVDWKWNNFPYNAGLTLLTELTWDKFEVDTTSISGIPAWPLTEPHILQPVEKIYYISMDNIEDYYPANYKDQWSVIEGKAGEDICYCCIPSEMDNAWSMYQIALSVAINNGDLEKLAKQK